jgi:HNH endonuclease
MPTDTPNVALLEQIRGKCREDPLSGCWLYELSVNNSGYANTRRFGAFLGGDSAMVQGSRLVYMALKGPIPDGFEVDHLCRNRRCLNGWHLEAVPPAINRQRNRVAEGHPLSAWWFRSTAEVPVPQFSSTCFVFSASTTST